MLFYNWPSSLDYYQVDYYCCCYYCYYYYCYSKLLSVAIYLGDKWKDKTLKCAMRHCFGVEHTILNRKTRQRWPRAHPGGPRPSLWPRTYFSLHLSLPVCSGKIFSARLNSDLQNGEMKRTERPEIAFHSITCSISSGVKARTSSKGDVSPKVTLAPFSFKL